MEDKEIQIGDKFIIHQNGCNNTSIKGYKLYKQEVELEVKDIHFGGIYKSMSHDCTIETTCGSFIRKYPTIKWTILYDKRVMENNYEIY